MKWPEEAETASEAAVCYKLLTKTRFHPQSIEHKHYHFHRVKCSFWVSPRKVGQFYYLILVPLYQSAFSKIPLHTGPI